MGGDASSVTSVVVYQNMFDGINSHIDAGENRLFLIGKYIDKFKVDQQTAIFVEREVRLDTRSLSKGSHFIVWVEKISAAKPTLLLTGMDRLFGDLVCVEAKLKTQLI